MSFNRGKFLIEVLGADGARALAKAAARSEYLAQMVVPRTILAWLEASPAYEGAVPGLDDCSLTFQKAEDGFTGAIHLAKGNYEFRSASIFHVAGAVATAMELDSLVFGNARNTELSRLGKSIDMMAKMRFVGQTLEKGEKCSECGALSGGHFTRKGVKCKSDKSDELEKKALGEGSGQSAGPVAPAAPQAPTANAPPVTTAQKLPKQPGSSQGAKPAKPITSSTVKLTRSETERNCSACSKRQFNGGKFVGCLCFSALAKSVKVLFHADQTADLTFGADWDRDSILTLLEACGRK